MTNISEKVVDKTFNLAFKFLELETVAAARVLENEDSENVAGFLANAPLALVAKLLPVMLPYYAAKLLGTEIVASKNLVGLWLSEISNNNAAAILRYASPGDQQLWLSQLSQKKSQACLSLLKYRADMVGAWVEMNVPIFTEDLKLLDCVKRLQKHRFTDDRRVLVVNDKRLLVGESAVNDILRGAPNLNMSDVMSPPSETISGRMLLSSAMTHPIWQRNDFAVVTNHQKECIGIIWFSRVRQLLSDRSIQHSGNYVGDSPLLELVQAHGESMRVLFDALKLNLH